MCVCMHLCNHKNHSICVIVFSACTHEERSQDDKGVDGQEVRELVARGDRRGLRLRDHARGEEPPVHVLRGESGRVRVEVLLTLAYPSHPRPS